MRLSLLLAWETSINIWLQRAAWMAPFMKFFSLLGTEDFFVVLIPFLYWCIDSAAGRDLALLLFSTNGVNGLFKLAFHAPRPYWISLAVQPLATEASYGFPSGHAAMASSCWPLLARRLRRRWALWSALALVLLISLSRLFLGVHFLTDLLGGWAVGISMLILFETAGRAWLRHLRCLQPISAVLQTALPSAVLLLLTWGIESALHGIQDPLYARWAASGNSAAWWTAQARDQGTFVATAGILWGSLAGLVLQERYANFSVAGTLLQKAGRFLLGMAGVLLLWRGLALLLPSGSGPAAQIWRFVRYALTGWWTVCGAPFVFLKTHLALNAIAPDVKGARARDSGAERS